MRRILIDLVGERKEKVLEEIKEIENVHISESKGSLIVYNTLESSLWNNLWTHITLYFSNNLLSNIRIN